MNDFPKKLADRYAEQDRTRITETVAEISEMLDLDELEASAVRQILIQYGSGILSTMAEACEIIALESTYTESG